MKGKRKGEMDFFYHTITTLILIFFYYVGFKFPDYDFKFKLSHRNILTHSPLLVIILFVLHQSKILTLTYKTKYDITDFVTVGLSLGIAIHLLYDLFPKSFKGTALLQFPIVEKSLSKDETIASIIIFIIFLTGFSVYKIKNQFWQQHFLSDYFQEFLLHLLKIFQIHWIGKILKAKNK